MPQRMSAFRPFVTNAALFINDQIGLEPDLRCAVFEGPVWAGTAPGSRGPISHVRLPLATLRTTPCCAR